MSKDNLKILSHNIWFAHLGSKGRNISERIDILIENINNNNYDIVLIQEGFILNFLGKKKGKEEMLYLVDKFKSIGFDYNTNIYNSIPYIGQNSGLVIFSKYEIIMENLIVFNTASIKEYINYKGFLHTKILYNDTILNVINVHLDSGSDSRNRYSQLYDIKQILNEIIASNEIIIIAGDFNTCYHTWDDGTMFKNLKKILSPLNYVTFYDKEKKNLADTFRFSSSTYDHVFIYPKMKLINKQIVDFKKDDIIVSDHYGISFELKL